MEFMVKYDYSYTKVVNGEETEESVVDNWIEVGVEDDINDQVEFLASVYGDEDTIRNLIDDDVIEFDMVDHLCCDCFHDEYKEFLKERYEDTITSNIVEHIESILDDGEELDEDSLYIW